MAPLRFGLIGTGYWALHTHGAALVSTPNTELCGVWGRDPAKANDVAVRLHTDAYDDLDALLHTVDAVAVAVPPDVQPDIVVRAARAGCHLFLEKPLALSVDAAEEVVREVNRAGVASVVFFTARFHPEIEGWVEAVASAGPWMSAHFVNYGNNYQPGSPYADSPWRRAHGALWDIGPHALAALVPIMGPVASVTARRGASGSDTVQLIVSHGSGPDPTGTSTVSLSQTIPPAATTSHLSLYGEHGVRVRPELDFSRVDACRAAIAELAALVSTGETHHRCDVGFARDVVGVLAAAERALAFPGVEPG